MTILDKLEALERGATPGPWNADPTHDSDQYDHAHVRAVTGEPIALVECGVNEDGDAKFIVFVRNAMPEILRVLRAADAWVAAEESMEVPADWIEQRDSIYDEMLDSVIALRAIDQDGGSK